MAENSRHRWLQNKLRTLLFVTALLAIPICCIGWRAKVLSQRDAIVKSFIDRGGKVYRIGHPMSPVLRFLVWDQRIAMIPTKALSPEEKRRIADSMPSDTIITDPAKRDAPPMR